MNCDCEIHSRGGYAVCEDCGEDTPVDELTHWRYEPELLLCTSCIDNRDEDEERSINED
jgi:RNA polymerase-binding transcription factor DksA